MTESQTTLTAERAPTPRLRYPGSLVYPSVMLNDIVKIDVDVPADSLPEANRGPYSTTVIHMVGLPPVFHVRVRVSGLRNDRFLRILSERMDEILAILARAHAEACASGAVYPALTPDAVSKMVRLELAHLTDK